MDRSKCEICRVLPEEVRVESRGEARSETWPLPPEAGRLETVAGHDVWDWVKVKRCPLCGTYYRYEYDQARDHWYPEVSETLRRITDEEAAALISGLDEQAKA